MKLMIDYKSGSQIEPFFFCMVMLKEGKMFDKGGDTIGSIDCKRFYSD